MLTITLIHHSLTSKRALYPVVTCKDNLYFLYKHAKSAQDSLDFADFRHCFRSLTFISLLRLHLHKLAKLEACLRGNS